SPALSPLLPYTTLFRSGGPVPPSALLQRRRSELDLGPDHREVRIGEAADLRLERQRGKRQLVELGLGDGSCLGARARRDEQEERSEEHTSELQSRVDLV